MMSVFMGASMSTRGVWPDQLAALTQRGLCLATGPERAWPRRGDAADYGMEGARCLAQVWGDTSTPPCPFPHAAGQCQGVDDKLPALLHADLKTWLTFPPSWPEERGLGAGAPGLIPRAGE